jgi:arylformamidase
MRTHPWILAVVAVLAVTSCRQGVQPGVSPSAGWMDISAPLDPATTPVYEGDAPVSITFLKDMRKGDPLTLSSMNMGVHSGTHVDAPMHFVENGSPTDQIAIDAFIGPARVIVIDDSVSVISMVELERHEWRGAERVLFRTRSSSGRWMRSSEFHRDFTYIAPDAARILRDAGVKLVGIDYLSVEKFGAPAPETHRILLGSGIPVVEGLLLEDVSAGDYDIVVLPIRLRGHEGAPARAILRKRNTR